MVTEKKKPARIGAVLRAYTSAARAYPGLLSTVIASTVTIVAVEVIAPLYLKIETPAVQQTPCPPLKTGRNEPCPCGSGKKFKHCCLNKKE